MASTSLFALLALFFAGLSGVGAFAAPSPHQIENFRWIVTPPKFGVASGSALPEQINVQHSNNNVGITQFEGRLYVAWRSAPTHFASKNVTLYVISSADGGNTWDYETHVALGYDIREPHLVEIAGSLQLYAFRGGKNALGFEPAFMFRSERLGFQNWTEPTALGRPGEVPWEIKIRDGQAYMASYSGSHYNLKPGEIEAYFTRSRDGIRWDPVGRSAVVYRGGVSEISFEWDPEDRIWAVTRNEDGDQTGWGSHLISTRRGRWDEWPTPQFSNPNRHDSPRMFRHGNELYLVARRDVGGPFDEGLRDLPFNLQRWIYLAHYSLRLKRTCLSWINRSENRIEWLEDLPSAGDNAFPSVVQLDTDRFLVANYTSPLEGQRWNWIHGQTSSRGTGLYLVEIRFNPQKSTQQSP